jgi:hypothetical protein
MSGKKIKEGLKAPIKHADRKWYAINPKKCGMGGIVNVKPLPRKQDKRFVSGEMYAVVFFPKINGIGNAQWWMDSTETLSRSPEAAISKFMDRIKLGEKWETYQKAGHRVRKVRIVDLGDARKQSRSQSDSFHTVRCP